MSHLVRLLVLAVLICPAAISASPGHRVALGAGLMAALFEGFRLARTSTRLRVDFGRRTL